jgi:hypothetical protein
LDWRAVRRQLLQRALLGFGALCLVVFGVIGAVIANSASRLDPESARATLGPIVRPDWHGVPQHPKAALLRALNNDSGQFVIADTSAAIGEWYDREWSAFGLHYAETTSRDGMTIRWFETTKGLTSDPMTGFRTDGHIFGFRRFGYAITSTESGRCTVTLMRTN